MSQAEMAIIALALALCVSGRCCGRSGRMALDRPQCRMEEPYLVDTMATLKATEVVLATSKVHLKRLAALAAAEGRLMERCRVLSMNQGRNDLEAPKAR